GEYTVKSQQRNINDFMKKVYFAYFKLKLGDQDKPWAPHKVYRRCEEDLRLWFKGIEKRNRLSFSQKREISFFCNDVQGLMKCFDREYDPSVWRLFIDSSKASLKAHLLQNGNSFASLHFGHSVHLDENYNDLSMILEKINYQEHR
ncbi:hypothetical protein AVEN_6514-1, partial [Araneus ventricosus]